MPPLKKMAPKNLQRGLFLITMPLKMPQNPPKDTPKNTHKNCGVLLSLLLQ